MPQATPRKQAHIPMQQDNQTDYRKLDDPEFLAERTHVRELLEKTTEESDDYTDLTRKWEGLEDEFIRRARCAWSKSMRRRKHLNPRRNP
jgi:hypothetical protein